jgi:NAD(P)-dependent dehydrogenase (short-subunit alcohol dehydrogenase family)
LRGNSNILNNQRLTAAAAAAAALSSCSCLALPVVLLVVCVFQTAQEVVDKVVEAFGKLDILVNNASEQHVRESVTDITPEQLQRTFATNVFGYFYMAQVRRAADRGKENLAGYQPQLAMDNKDRCFKLCLFVTAACSLTNIYASPDEWLLNDQTGTVSHNLSRQ